MTSTRHRWLRAHRGWLFAAIFVFGAGIRAIDLWRPVDSRVRESWRECDEAAIARNYVREGMNILYPRIDWRGDGPGFAEMEFPVFPWTIAVMYETFGFHEVLGRILAYGFALATLAIFLALARRLLPWRGALAAGAFFALSPLIVRISNALQPEALMLFAYVAAVYAFLRWADARQPGRHAIGWWLAASLATALAILAKATAAHVGILFAVILWQRRRWAALHDPLVWAFAVVALVPSLLWYSHAHTFWITYGNSLGVSNEDHWIGPDVFRSSSFALGLLTAELFYVWTPAGAITAIYGLSAAPRGPAGRVAIPWLIGILLFYVAAIRTTAASWALYYHVFSAPPVALLFGLGVAQVARLRWPRRMSVLVAAAALPVMLVVAIMVRRHTLVGYDSAIATRLMLAALVALFAVAAVVAARRRARVGTQRLAGPRIVPFLAAAAAPVAILWLAGQVEADAHPHTEVESYAAAQHFAPLIPPGVRILTSGAPCGSAMAARTAYNLSFMFYWLDRKGFNVCVEEQSMSRIDGFVRRGAEYFVAKDVLVHAQPDFAGELGRRYPVVSTSHGWSLYALTDSGTATHAR